MDKKLNEFEKLYNDIKIPDNLDRVIDDAINRERDNKVVVMKKTKRKIFKTISITAASLVLVIGLTVNSSYGIAEEIYKIPVIGELAKMMTFREYVVENETSIKKVTIPNVEIENTVVEELINDTINKKVNEILEEQAILDAEYKKAYLETGGKEENFNKIEMTVDYKLYYASDNVISFEIFKYQTLAPAYNENYYYNINLKTGKNVTLENLLGEDYASLVKESVEKQIINRMEENPDLVYNLDWFREVEIHEDRGFYVNENGDIVVAFAKYEIAPGSMGKQEFVVGSINNVRFPDEVTIIGEEIFSVDAKYISSTSNTITLNIDGQELTLQSMMQYDYEKGELLKVKYVLEDGKRLVMLQCYPARNRIEITVEKLLINEDGLITIKGKTSDRKTYTTSIDPGVKVNSHKKDLKIGDKIEIYYDSITDDKVKHIIPYVINLKDSSK
ncbi:DUF3298 domain-containing protein [Wukongibacter baidiensis]|uniref:DUF3298 and DUF4163 domain-containing protein n=1 Tax=Wukongibacter baidiensis TaxID=1723361 RepID=UPI003D7FF5FF